MYLLLKQQSNALTDMKKLFCGSLGTKAYLPARKCGYYRDKEEQVWECFTPTVNDLSSFVRMEHPTRRTRFVYAPDMVSGGFRRTLLKRRPRR